MSGVKINTNILVVAVLVFAAFFIYMVVTSSGPGLLKVATKGGNSLVVDFSGREYELTTLIDKVLEDEEQTAIARALLRERYGLYDVTSTEFVDYLRRLSPSDDVSKEIIGLLVDGAGPFDYQFHTYRNIHTLSAALEIIELDYKSPAAVRLREAADRQEGIFRQVGVPVRVTFVPVSRLGDKLAAVCSAGKRQFLGHDLVLANREVADRMVSVFARNPFTCFGQDNQDGTPVITINTNTGKALYGSAQLDQVEQALLYVVPLGYQVKAITTGETAVSVSLRAPGGGQ